MISTFGAVPRANASSSTMGPSLPSSAETNASKKMARPKPPASTTPFSLSTGSRSGVRCTEA